MNKSSLEYGNYDFKKYGYMKAPEPRVNGGLYTGKKAVGDYVSIPVSSDIGILTNENLRSANGPVEGLFHYPGYNRPGNNSQETPGIVKYSNVHNIKGLSSEAVYNVQKELQSNVVLPYSESEGCPV